MTKLQLELSDTGHSARDDNMAEFKGVSEWKCCRLSNKKLQLPIVSDCKGHLFNKEAILEWLLTPGREDYSQVQISQFSHIRKLDDVVELRGLKEQGDSLICEYGDNIVGETGAKLIYLVPCGDMLPNSSLQVLEKKFCPKCGESFQESDVIMINPSSPMVIESLKDRAVKLQQQMKHHNGKPRRKPKRKTTLSKTGPSKKPKKL